MGSVIQRCASVFVIILLVPLFAAAAELSKGEKDTILIGDLVIQPAVSERAMKKKRISELQLVSDSLRSQLIAALNATRVFQLVEQEHTATPQPEQDSDPVSDEPSDKNGAQVARKVGAKFAFLPRIDGFEDTTDTVEHYAIGRATVNRKVFLSAIVRVVDTATGAVLPDSPSVQLTRAEEKENVRSGAPSGSDEVIISLAREMAKRLSQDAVALVRPAKVLMVSGRQILVNRGSEAAFAKGDLMEIYSVQNVKDEDTGELFRNEVPVGQATISRLEKNQSYATINGDDSGITKGCVVRFVKTAASRAAEAEPPPDVTLPDFGTKSEAGNTPGSSEKPLKWK